jgi:hypothetical protein
MQVNCLRLPCWNQWRSGEKDRCGRRGFRRDLCVIEDSGSGLKPLLQKPSFCRSGFRRDLCAIENQKLGVAGAASVANLAPSKTAVRG